MKKIISVVLLLMLVLFIFGCSKQAQEKQESNGEQTEISQGVNEVAQESQDLSSDSVDNLDSDLDSIAW